MADPTQCPNCGEAVPSPQRTFKPTGQQWQMKRDCPGCGEQLVYFAEGEMAGGWRLADGEQRRRAHIANYED